MSKKKEPIQLEAAFKRLEEIVQQLESGEESLEKSLELFEEGVRLTQACRQTLEQAEQKIKTLVKQSDGTLTVEDPD
ncbi:MAG: exodeoxyribonuclease VII small subunit [FCB group bacterium]|nr:exodeoxyribonuclease VII small subunit [FCB group bacterium]